MSEWITDRKPTAVDADRYGYIWVAERIAAIYEEVMP